MKNLGFKNEHEIMLHLNNHKLSEINSNLRYELIKEFDNINGNTVLRCLPLDRSYKSDISLIINDQIFGLSIKSGIGNSVHEEYLESFISFLRDIGVSNRTLKIIRFFHYGDGSIDGSGNLNMQLGEIKYKYYKEIMEANIELSNPRIIYEVAKRALVEGVSKTNCADYFYYGTINYGSLIKKNDVLRFVMRNRCMEIDSIHFGPFVFQPYCRNASDERKKKIQLKWHSLISDVYSMKIIRDASYGQRVCQMC